MNVDPSSKALLGADPVFRALSRSLWSETELRGAALMVGAGISRNAVLPAPTSPKPPLWGDLIRAMREELGLDRAGSPGALKLAQRYEEMFGRGRLEGLIRELVPDLAWEPGAHHTRLLRLPWTEILTTNYDTLLERAADRLTEPAYEAVLTPADIARTRAPRIVKLHGTLPSHTPFVITANDYHDYPSRFAPFVNLARQVLLENDLCMLGFSGSDPNFVAWSGWVRAELAPYSRTVFLVGVLDLTGDARDDYLERGITPIDLGPLVPTSPGGHDDRSAMALELFLATLESVRPSPVDAWPSSEAWPRTAEPPPKPNDPKAKWRGVHDPGFAAEFVERCAERWRSERSTYPGWIEPPPLVRERVGMELRDHLIATQNGLSSAKIEDRPRVLADLLWRLDLVQGTWYDSDLRWLDPLIASLDQSALSVADCLLLGRLMLRAYREQEDRASVDRWRGWLEATVDRDDGVRALLDYEEALWYRDRLDLERLSDLVSNVYGNDPIWQLRKAMLLSELGDQDGVETALIDAYRELKARTVRDRRSLWIRSRLAWAGFLAHVLTDLSLPDERIPELVEEGLADRGWLRRFDEGACNPWPIIEALDDGIEAAEKRRREDCDAPRALFDPGMTTGPGVTFRSMPLAEIDRRAVRLSDHVGLPSSLIGRANLMESRIARAVDASADASLIGMARTLLAAYRTEKPLLEGRFNRIAVARLEQKVVEDLIVRLRRAIAYALPRLSRERPERHRSFRVVWLGRLQTLTEILSRVVVRASTDQARQVFELSVDLARHPAFRYPGLHGPLDNLVRRSHEAMPPAARSSVGLNLLLFPLPGEVGARDSMNWPDPLDHVEAGDLGCPSNDAKWLDRIGGLIMAVRTGDLQDCSAAAKRLVTLSHLDLLGADERAAFGEAVWSRREKPGGLALSAEAAVPTLFEAPSPNPLTRTKALRALLLGDEPTVHPEPSLASVWLLRVAGNPDPSGLRKFLSPDEILRMFDGLAAWRPPEREGRLADWFGVGERHDHQLAMGVATALAFAILPGLEPHQLDTGRVGSLRELAAEPCPATIRMSGARQLG